VTKITWQKNSHMRKGSARVLDAVTTFCHLGENQPLLLQREPDNPVHSGAVLVSDLMGAPCGYVAREHAGEVSAKMAAGELVLCKTVGPCLCIARRIVLWTEGEEVSQKEETYVHVDPQDDGYGPSHKIREKERA
jgi:hypothetical protein